jgi:hypothetical protein
MVRSILVCYLHCDSMPGTIVPRVRLGSVVGRLRTYLSVVEILPRNLVEETVGIFEELPTQVFIFPYSHASARLLTFGTLLVEAR